jgi:MOSC domain-containing protein YiiM
MIIIGNVLGVFSAKEKSGTILRPSVSHLNLIQGHGIEHDRYAGKDLSKTVMIVGKKAYDIAKEHGINLISGSFGENLLTDFDPHDFTEDMIIGIGDAQLRITESCSVCKHLSVYDERLPELVQYHRGVYCEILDGGVITKNQIVHISK